jgi:lysophospholipase L1-like esterase
MAACVVAWPSGCSSPNSSSGLPVAGANGGQSSTSTGTGGTTEAGGISGGGLTATGGRSSAGGTLGTGGSAVTGGIPNTGGLARTGGIPASGGSTSAGGTTGGATTASGGTGAGGQFSPDAGLGGASAAKDAMGPDALADAKITPDSRNAGGAPDLGSTGSGGGGAGGTGNSAGSTGGAAGGSSGEVPLDPTLLAKCTGTNPINCAFSASNGNYTVTVELGSATAAATTRVRAETRRIVLQPTNTAAGAYFRYTFAVNVRAEDHDGYSAPGNILNLSFDGATPALHGVGFASASIPTIFVAGDSTVCDWDPPTYNPFAPDGTDVAGWAQELSQFLSPGIAVANYADSGETAGSFYTKFYPPEKAAMKQGDFLFVQFGHNDMKSDTAAQYQANLTKYLTDAKTKNVTPVLITPVARSGATSANHGFNGFDDTMRALATAQNVALIDLTNLALTYYGTLSSSAKSALFVDGTHFHEPGATQIANLVAQAMKGLNIGLEGFVK